MEDSIIVMGSVADNTASPVTTTTPRLNKSSRHAKRGKGSVIMQHLQFLDELLEVALGSLLGHDVEHLLADGADLTGLGVASRLGLLVALLLGEANAEESQGVAISGAHINEGLDKRLPLADKGAQLIAGDVHAMEVSDHIVSLNILSHELDLSVSLGLVTTVEVGKRHLEHTALKTLRSDLGTNSLRDDSSSGVAGGKHGRGLHLVGLLFGEGVHTGEIKYDVNF